VRGPLQRPNHLCLRRGTRQGEPDPRLYSPKNHDYYAFVYGVLPMLATLNQAIPAARPNASYFCLRTEDVASIGCLPALHRAFGRYASITHIRARRRGRLLRTPDVQRLVWRTAPTTTTTPSASDPPASLPMPQAAAYRTPTTRHMTLVVSTSPEIVDAIQRPQPHYLIQAANSATAASSERRRAAARTLDGTQSGKTTSSVTWRPELV
jgi:hypothetical protein